MAGMFYSLNEAAEKLNKTKEEVKDLAKQGKLREFRDGSNVLFKIDEVEALMADTSVPASKDLSIPLEEPKESIEVAESEEAAESEQIFEPEQAKTPELPTEFEEMAGEEEISLLPETGIPASDSELTSADTALTGEGINVLGETDRDYKVTDDTMAETTAIPGATGTAGITGTTGEAALEEIEEDVNLDTFGSGSGLLDLSLQADDTSLGGILDEIYTTEGEEGQEPAEPGAAVDLAAETEHILPEEVMAGPQPIMEAPAIAQPAYIETLPDALGNSLGIMLFLPLLALIYAAIVTVAGLKKVMPAILGQIQTPYIALYIMVGFSVAAGLAFGVSYILSGGLAKTGKKEKKPKKTKKAKKTATEEETSV